MIDINPTERQALADQCGVAEQYLYQVFSRRKVASPELCVLIEKAIGSQVTRKDLRPDDYWLIWPDLPAPELATKEDDLNIKAEAA